MQAPDLLATKEGTAMYNEACEANYMEISRQVLEENAKTVTSYVGVPVIGVVKYDGCGVGIEEAAKAWQKAGVEMFAVSESWEALALRQAGFTEEILLMAPVADVQEFRELLARNIILTVSDLENARFYQEHREGTTVRAHVKVDAGMGRFGVRWTDTQQLKEIYGLEGFSFEGIFSHFSKSFEKTYKLTKEQLNRFLKAVQTLTDAGISVGMRHMANSCAALRFPETRLDAVRVGSGLVGALLVPAPVTLQLPHACKARVVAVKSLKKGDTMGYAAVCKAKKDVKAAVVEVGYKTGLGMTGAPDPFPLKDLAVYLYYLLLRYLRPPCATAGDKKLPLIGRVGSQYTLFDATGTDVKPGDYVTVRISLLQCTAKRKYI